MAEKILANVQISQEEVINWLRQKLPDLSKDALILTTFPNQTSLHIVIRDFKAPKEN